MSRWPANATVRELYGPAMEIESREEAAAYLRDLVDWAVTEHRQDPEAALRTQKINLGYYAGYCGAKTMERVNGLFDTEHPIFGNTAPTAEQAIAAGMRMGRAARAESE